MDDFDEADLDGDGEFDAIDMMIMEEEDADIGSEVKRGGCCIPLFIAAGLIGSSAGLYLI